MFVKALMGSNARHGDAMSVRKALRRIMHYALVCFLRRLLAYSFAALSSFCLSDSLSALKPRFFSTMSLQKSSCQVPRWRNSGSRICIIMYDDFRTRVEGQAYRIHALARLSKD